jgi:hypothetical protein
LLVYAVKQAVLFFMLVRGSDRFVWLLRLKFFKPDGGLGLSGVMFLIAISTLVYIYFTPLSSNPSPSNSLIAIIAVADYTFF